MLYKKTKVLCWNVRGLGLFDKCNVVRETIRASRCNFCMLQETKLNELCLSYVMKFLPSYFDPCCVFNLANQSKWDILIVWKRNFEMIKCWSTYHTTPVLLKNQSTCQLIFLTVLYGPCTDVDKPSFIMKLASLIDLIHCPWILAGDFNLVRWLADRFEDLWGTPLMDLLNEFIQDSDLVDIP